ncbi:MAG: Nucleolar RNA-binding protein Nop10p family [Thermoplasmata archaeon]|nr:Nucleolar RNA-binding protein Nop10p family [Thermoplasmata archaeon]
MSLLKCAEHGYTLKAACPACGKATAQPGPAKFSPEDRYGAYRRKLKAMDRAKGRSA